jgi:hypothetical protein
MNDTDMSDDKKQKVATALLDLTERETLSWEAFEAEEEADVSLPGDRQTVYATLHEDMGLYLYRPEGEGEADDGEAPATVLKVVDPESGIGWTFPELEVLDELYEVVHFRTSGLEAWMDDILEDAPLEEDGAEASPASPEPVPEETGEERSAGEPPEGVPGDGYGTGEAPASGEASDREDPESAEADAAEASGLPESRGADVFGDEEDGVGSGDEVEDDRII